MLGRGKMWGGGGGGKGRRNERSLLANLFPCFYELKKKNSWLRILFSLMVTFCPEEF